MAQRHQRGLGAYLNEALVIRADDGEELDRVAETASELEISDVDLVHALNMDAALGNPKAVAEGGEDDGFVRRIPAAHVQGGVSLRVAFFLSLAKGISIAQSCLTHAGQDVIAGAIDDAVNGEDAVAHQPFLQDLNDGNATRDGCFKVNRHAALLGEGEELLATLSQQRFVARDDDFFARRAAQTRS